MNNKEKNEYRKQGFKYILDYYNNKPVPANIQKTITLNWNRLQLWKLNNYSGQRLDLKTLKIIK